MKKAILYLIMMVISMTIFSQSVFTVTKSTDPDPFEHPFNNNDELCDPEMYGTLQWAINKANDDNDHSRIEFNVPGDGPHEIVLINYLPQITGPTIIDATSQPGFSIGSPAIIISGISKTSVFNVYNTEFTLKGFHINSIPQNGILLTNCTNVLIENNIVTHHAFASTKTPYIGVFINGCQNVTLYGNEIEVILPEEISETTKSYGIYASKSSNCIIGGTENGDGNLIKNCRTYGVFLNSTQTTKISGNTIFDCGKAIYLNSSNNNIQQPVINDYTDGLLKGTALPNAIIEIFGSTGLENANEYLTSTVADGNGDWDVVVNTEFEGFIASQTGLGNNTSTFSIFQSKLPCYQVEPILYPTDSGEPVADDFWVQDPNVHPDMRCCSGVPPCECEEGCFWLTSTTDISAINIYYPEPSDLNVQIQCSICVNDDTPLYIHEATVGLYAGVQHEWHYTSSGIEITSSGYYEIISFTASEAGIGTHTITCCGECDDYYDDAMAYACRTAIITVYEPDATINNPGSFCFGDPASTLTAATPGGVWSGDGIIDASTGQFDPSDLNPGNYTISYSVDKDGCYDEDEITITVLNIPNPTVSDNEVCVGDATTMFTLSGISVNGESYSWSSPTGLTSTSNTINIDNAEINMDGLYTVTVTDIETGCSSIASGNLTVHESPEITFSEFTGICQGETLSITASGGTSYEWSNGSPGATTIINTGGTYMVTVSNENCSTTASIDVPESNITISLIEYNSSCENDETGLLIIEANDGMPPYTYNWIGPGTFSSTSPTINSLAAGSYSVTVEDQIGCTLTENFIIESTSVPNVTILGANYICYEDETTLTASSATAEIYEWSNGDTNYLTYINSTDTYSVTVEDVHGCTNSDQIEVAFIPAPIINPATNTYCEGEMTIQIFNPEGLTSFIEIIDENDNPYWNEIVNEFGLISFTIANIGAGDYTVNYHVENGAEILCPYSEEFTINANPIAEITGDSFACEGSIDITATGGIYYNWNNGLNVQTITVEETNTYIVTVTDEYGCTAQDEFYVEIANEIEYVTAVYQDDDICTGIVQFLVSPGGEFSVHLYNLSVGVEYYNGSFVIPNNTLFPDNPIELSQISGVYQLELTSHETGCKYYHDFIIPEACPDITVESTPGTCVSPYNATVEVTITDGTPPYEVYIGQGFNIASTIYTFTEPGTYILEPNESFSPDLSFNVIVNDNDPYYNENWLTHQPALHFQWSPYNVITTANLTEELYQDMIICIGNANDQTLNISHDVTFSNCHIYTNTQGSTDTHSTIWKVNYDDHINMVSGHLHIINGTNIESGCPDKMWEGIEARSEFNVDCETMLIDIVDSKISDAMHAIKLWGNVHLNTDNSTFENNRIGIHLSQVGGISFSHTYIKNNIFQTTSPLNNPLVYPKAHVYLNWASDITFKNNDFINSRSMFSNEVELDEYTADKRGKGIEAVFSSFIVTPISNPIYAAPQYNSKNYFEGLFYAIDARGQRTYAPKVYHSDFVNNFRGIHLQGTNGSRVLFNEINTTNAEVDFETNNISLHGNPISGDISYGVYIDRALNIWFEENTIYNGKAGSYVFSTGNTSTRYYRNKFGDPDDETRGMEAATIVVGKNSDYIQGNPEHPGLNGLEVSCNNYIANNNAISVLNGNMRKNQGVDDGTTDQLAGNQFHSSFTNGTEFKVQIYENIYGPSQFSYLDLGIYNYFQHNDNHGNSDNNGFYRTLPETLPSLDPETQLLIPFVELEACPSHYSLPVVHDPDIVISDISFQTNTIETLENQYDEIIDRGDSEYMTSVAEELNPHNFRQYATILDNNGYLSDQVFLTLLDNNLAQKPVIASILIANSPLPENILEEVNNSTYLDNGHKNKILKYQEGINPRLLLEYEMADVKQKIIYLEGELVNNAINNDSIIGVKEIAINYFNSKPIQQVIDLQTIYNLSISSNDYTMAESILSDLRVTANILPADEAIEVIRFCDVNQLYISVFNDTANYSLLYDNKDLLLEAARSSSPDYSATAEILYSLTTDSSFYEYTPMPFDEMGPRSIQNNSEFSEEIVNKFDIYPNPAINTLNIVFNLSATFEDGYEVLYETMGIKKQDGCSFGKILIYTNDAKLIETIPLESIYGKLTINMESYKPGVYLIEIVDCYGNNRTKKITKTQ